MMKNISVICLVLLFGALGSAQQQANNLAVYRTGGAVGSVCFYALDNVHATCLKAADTISSTVILRLPTADGTSGQVIKTDGAGNLSFVNSPAPAVPLILSGTSASPILTLIQLGAGFGLAVTGTSIFSSTVTASAGFNVSGNTVSGTGDNAYMAVDAGGNLRLGFTKKSGDIPRLTYGNAVNFELAQSNAADIGAGNTFTVRLALNATSGAPSFNFSDATTGAIFNQAGSGHVITINVNNASSAVSVANTSSGAGGAFSSSSGAGISGTSSSGIGVSGLSTSSVGVSGVSVNGKAGEFTGLSTGSVGITAAGVLLAAHFTTGDVTVDNTLTAGALSGPQPGGVNASGATVLADAFQVNGTGGWRIYRDGGTNSTIIGRTVSSQDIVLDTSGNATFAHAVTITGASTLTGAVGVTAGITLGASSNSYFRTFSGAPSCAMVTDGWFGFDTSLGILYICNGGVATTH